MHHCVAVVVAVYAVNKHQNGLECGFAEKNSKHLNVETVGSLCMCKIAAFYGLSYRDVSKFSGNIVVDRVFRCLG